MADSQPNPDAPLTQEAFLLDRQRTYALFGGLTFYGTASVVVILLLLAFFLL